jgi:hypothetical protein
MKRERQLIINFMQLHSLKVGECKTMLEAYEETEKVWVNETGKTFYKNYNSFLASRNHYRKSRGRINVMPYRILSHPKF